MFKKDDIVDIKMSQGEFVGKVGHTGGSCIELKDIVSVNIKEGSDQAEFVPMKATVVFYGNMLVQKLTEDHPYYATYKQATSGIILPVSGRFNN